MRVLLGAARVGDLPAGAALAALSAGWSEVNPGADVVGVICSDGADDLLDAVEQAHGGARDVTTATTGDGRGSAPALVLLVAGSAYLQASDVLGSLRVDDQPGDDQPRDDQPGDDDGAAGAPADLGLRVPPGGLPVAGRLLGTSHGVGLQVLAALEGGARRVVIGAGDSPVLDLGIGMLQGLAGLDPQEWAVDVASERLADLLTRARSRLAGIELVLAAGTARPVRGLRGAAAALVPLLGQEGAARLDADVAPLVEALGRQAALPRRDLLGGQAVKAQALPGSGAGGGLGPAVVALGGRIVAGPRFVAAETDLLTRAGVVDLAVSLTDRIDPVEADTGVLGVVASVAAPVGAAVLALGRHGTLGRRGGAPFGISSAALVPGDAEGLRAAGIRHGTAWRW